MNIKNFWDLWTLQVSAPKTTGNPATWDTNS